MTISNYLDLSGYPTSQYHVLNAEDSQLALSKVTDDDKGVSQVIRDPMGKKSFGDGAHIFKKSFLQKHNIEIKDNIVVSENKEVEIPKPNVELKDDGKTFTVPKPPSQEKPKIDIPKPDKIVNEREDHILDDVVYEQSVVDGRKDFLVKHGCEEEGNNIIVLGKSYTPVELYKLDMAQWDKLTTKVAEEYEKNKPQQEDYKDDFQKEMNEPVKEAVDKIDKTFEPESKEEKPKVEKSEEKPKEINTGKVKLRVGMLVSVGMTVDKKTDGLVHKDTGYYIDKESLSSLNTSEFEELLNHIKLDFKSKIKTDVIQKPNEDDSSEEVDYGLQNRIKNLNSLGFELDKKSKSYILEKDNCVVELSDKELNELNPVQLRKRISELQSKLQELIEEKKEADKAAQTVKTDVSKEETDVPKEKTDVPKEETSTEEKPLEEKRKEKKQKKETNITTFSDLKKPYAFDVDKIKDGLNIATDHLKFYQHYYDTVLIQKKVHDVLTSSKSPKEQIEEIKKYFNI